jgi:N-acetyl sugar amidotransferase
MTLYGLPETVTFCKRCTMSNQRPASEIEFKHHIGTQKRTLHIDNEGVCDACRAAERKKEVIDWEVRDKQLQRLCDRYRRNDGGYDCLVPGSGGKDSFYAAWMLKYKYGMNPLTCTWAPNMYTDWGWRNFQRWIHAGFTNHLHTPNGLVHRILTRLAVDNLLHFFQPFILGQKNLAPKVALEQGIKLVFYGEAEAEYGNPIAEMSGAKRDFKYFSSSSQDDIYLGGVSIKSLKDDYGLSACDLAPYLPANPDHLTDKGVEIHYLGYYLKWHPQNCYFHAVEHAGFEPSPVRTPGTYSKYNSIDDKIDDFHYFSTFIKFGIGRATYDSAQEIRSGDITREEGVALVHKYDGEWPERFAQEVIDYLNVEGFPKYDMESFKAHFEKFKSPHIWDGDKLRSIVE